MQKRILGNGPQQWPLLGFGCMRLPLKEDGSIDEATAREMLQTALQAGANYLDTAYMYHGGESERFLGRALAGVPRDSYLLADKLPTYLVESLEDVERIFAEQLGRCGVECFDSYLLHALDQERFERMEALGVVQYLRGRQAAGQIGKLGFSFHDTPEVLEQICAAHAWDFAQIQLNYYDWETYRSREQYEVLQAHGLPVVVMEPLRGGWLADLGEQANAPLLAAAPHRSIASWGLRFAAGLPGVVTVLSGMSAPAHMQDNIATMQDFTPLTGAEQAALQQALELFWQNANIPCSGCRYCLPCTVGIEIPMLFARYNATAKDGDMAAFERSYSMMDDADRAENCTACGHCAPMCPQKIDIPRMMKGIADRTEPSALAGR